MMTEARSSWYEGGLHGLNSMMCEVDACGIPGLSTFHRDKMGAGGDLCQCWLHSQEADASGVTTRRMAQGS